MQKKISNKITLDNLARMTQQEFVAVHEEVKGVKEDVGTLKEDVSILRRDMEAGFSEVGGSIKEVMGKLNEIQRDVVETHDLRSRLERLEKKVGLPR